MASNTVLMNGANNENMHQNQHLPQVHAPAQPPTHLLQHQHQHQHHGQYHHNQHQQHRQQQQNGHSYDVVSHNASFVDQMSMARKASGSHDYHSNQGHPKHYQMKNGDDFDPQSNVYVANLPSDYGKERLYALFSKYGQIVRYKFVTPDEPSQPGYGFVQFSNPKDAHTAINNLEGHLFSTGETIYLSIALRRRSSLSEEPTNLYVKNLPSSWTNEKLKEVFGAYGSIRQSKVVGDGIAFVRFDDHDEALNAIGHLDKQQVEQGCKLEVRFATRKTAANAYRLQQVPVATKHNEHNLYIRNLPKYYNQSSLETLFSAVGKISSAKINENGIAFVRFADAQDAKRAIQEMNGTKPPQFDEEIVVKLAHFDIGDSRNRWSNKFGGSGGHGHVHGGGGGGTPNGPLSNGSHFNTNMYQNHMNAPIGSMNAFNGFHGNTVNVNGSNPSPLSSVPSSVSGTGNVADAHSYAYGSAPHPHHQQQQQQQQQAPAPHPPPHVAPQAEVGLGAMNQMQALQQSMQQWNLNAGSSGVNAAKSNVSNLMFPAGAPMMMAPSTLFASGGAVNAAPAPAVTVAGNNNNISAGATATLARQSSADSVHSGGNSPHSNGSNEGNRKPNWSKKEQQLGDQLYAKLVSKCPVKLAGKITGMLIKMGDKKAQQCLDNPQYLEQQIQLAKKLLTQQESTEGVPAALSPTALYKMNQFTHQMQAAVPQQQQQRGDNAALETINTSSSGNQALNAAQLGSIPNLYPNSFLNAGVPNLFQTPPQLFATLSPTSTANAAAGGNNRSPKQQQNGRNHPSPQHALQQQQHHQQQQQQQSVQQTPSPHKNRLDFSHHAGSSTQQPQYLFTTIPNLGSPMAAVSSPAQQQVVFNGTPKNDAGQTQTSSIQQSGWGLALGHGQNNINVIPTQNATAFMNPALYPRAQ
mmetsp:Transcript_56067/g.93452  ORF Transcript_56067/g.93452 Transcript_56067/m.93452 type:complete len:919 (+) Transcript_56067:180-2936(+)|eukprot:CAMPEP_0202692504 /NCGR_PEP_ID=MMETSP1385-20130828/6862_1 /ASSEMBLY_ACC=CAM_ASM_000861 /TAXON_ID=933848 /ORGANISM="Elphidium margaritaceum" /LENGTH=918 /DNA_ID=CAMNT_0049348043 /DNA_START=175 /DNA_END=2931 /DNA_ORIENTATION=+